MNITYRCAVKIYRFDLFDWRILIFDRNISDQLVCSSRRRIVMNRNSYFNRYQNQYFGKSIYFLSSHADIENLHFFSFFFQETFRSNGIIIYPPMAHRTDNTCLRALYNRAVTKIGQTIHRTKWITNNIERIG